MSRAFRGGMVTAAKQSGNRDGTGLLLIAINKEFVMSMTIMAEYE